MVDIHNHLLYGIDDGAKTIEESIEIIGHLKDIGITDIILTPHYINGSSYCSPRKVNEKLIKNLQSRVKDVNLYLGNEIYMNEYIKHLLNNRQICPLNDTNYLLIELPMSGVYDYYEDILAELIEAGYNVVLAHPERYETVKNDFDILYKLKDMGVLFQSNVTSLAGFYGTRAKETCERLVQEHMITFFGTDTHHDEDYSFLESAKLVMKKYIDDKEIKKLLEDNAKELLLHSVK